MLALTLKTGEQVFIGPVDDPRFRVTVTAINGKRVRLNIDSADLKSLSVPVGYLMSLRIDIRLRVLSISGNQVNLGIEAPKAVPVHREKIAYRIQLERAERASWTTMDLVTQ